MKTTSQPYAANAPHANLAASKAYLELGNSQLAADQPQNAVECAKAGLADLGQDYTTPTTIDDTDMKLLAAEDQAEAGQTADAATGLLRVLEARISMYEKLYASELAP